MSHNTRVRSRGMVANKIHEKPCAYCNVMMTGNKARQTFCSQTCANKGTAVFSKVYNNVCLTCGNTYETKRKVQKFCCMDCHSKGRMLNARYNKEVK